MIKKFHREKAGKANQPPYPPMKKIKRFQRQNYIKILDCQTDVMKKNYNFLKGNHNYNEYPCTLQQIVFSN
jgi:hypothetical protein